MTASAAQAGGLRKADGASCAFSGLNNPLDGAEAGPGMVQSFGQIVKQTGPLGGIPGTECNGHTGDLAGS